jgi:hypothetical protein
VIASISVVPTCACTTVAADGDRIFESEAGCLMPPDSVVIEQPVVPAGVVGTPGASDRLHRRR